MLNQCASYAFAANSGLCEQVLQVDIVTLRPAAAVNDVMDESNQGAIDFCNGAMHGFLIADESSPRLTGHCIRNFGLIKNLIFFPQG
jgi:hypothetical protein